MENSIGNLGYLFLLQGFGHINQVCGVPFLTNQVEIPCVVESHDITPVQIFLKDVQHLLLLHNIFQYFGILAARNPKKQPIVIFHDVEQFNIAGTGQQITIIIIDRIAQRIVIGIEGAGSFEQPHFVIHPPLAENAYRFRRMTFDAVIRYILRNNILHPLLDASHIFQFNGTPDTQITEIAFRHGVFYKQLAFGKQLCDSLEQYKPE